jgi:hypothetical protein
MAFIVRTPFQIPPPFASAYPRHSASDGFAVDPNPKSIFYRPSFCRQEDGR